MVKIRRLLASTRAFALTALVSWLLAFTAAIADRNRSTTTLGARALAGPVGMRAHFTDMGAFFTFWVASSALWVFAVGAVHIAVLLDVVFTAPVVAASLPAVTGTRQAILSADIAGL